MIKKIGIISFSKVAYNVRPALRRQGLGFQKLNFAPMFNNGRMLRISTIALLLQNWLLYAVFLGSQTSLINNLK